VVQHIVDKPLPNPDDLNEAIPKNEWELDLNGNPRPPWQRTYVVYLLDPRDCQKYTFANSTLGARIATETLTDRVVWMRRLRGNNVVPQIELSCKPLKTRFGLKQRPEFKIVGWHLLGGSDGSAPTLSGGGGEQLALRGLSSVTPPTLDEELNDEIPI
jgi:hypothetical protein